MPLYLLYIIHLFKQIFKGTQQYLIYLYKLSAECQIFFVRFLLLLKINDFIIYIFVSMVYNICEIFIKELNYGKRPKEDG